MLDLQKKITIFGKYKNEQGVLLGKKDHDRLLGPEYDTAKAEFLMSRAMYKARETIAAILI